MRHDFLCTLNVYCLTFLNTVDDEVQEHLEKAKAEKVIEEVVRNFKEI